MWNRVGLVKFLILMLRTLFTRELGENLDCE